MAPGSCESSSVACTCVTYVRAGEFSRRNAGSQRVNTGRALFSFIRFFCKNSKYSKSISNQRHSQGNRHSVDVSLKSRPRSPSWFILSIATEFSISHLPAAGWITSWQRSHEAPCLCGFRSSRLTGVWPAPWITPTNPAGPNKNKKQTWIKPC